MAEEKTVIKLFNSLGIQIAEIPLSRPAIEVYNKAVALSRKGNNEKAITLF